MPDIDLEEPLTTTGLASHLLRGLRLVVEERIINLSLRHLCLVAVLVLCGAVVLGGCGPAGLVQAFDPPTATPLPTNTPLPTATPVPPTATAVAHRDAGAPDGDAAAHRYPPADRHRYRCAADRDATGAGTSGYFGGLPADVTPTDLAPQPGPGDTTTGEPPTDTPSADLTPQSDSGDSATAAPPDTVLPADPQAQGDTGAAPPADPQAQGDSSAAPPESGEGVVRTPTRTPTRTRTPVRRTPTRRPDGCRRAARLQAAAAADISSTST